MRLKFVFESKLLLVLMIGYRGLLRAKMVLKSLVLLVAVSYVKCWFPFPFPFFSNSKRLSVIVVNFAAYALVSFAVYKNDVRPCTQ